jgi:hypothetical protein
MEAIFYSETTLDLQLAKHHYIPGNRPLLVIEYSAELSYFFFLNQRFILSLLSDILGGKRYESAIYLLTFLLMEA